MKTLKDLAGLYKTLAQTNLTTGKTRAYKTGNLYTQVSQKNTADNMVSSPSKGKYVITLNYGPDQAEYGKFVNDGTKYIEPQKFANRALRGAIDKNIKLIVRDLAKIIGDEIRDNLGKV